MTIRKQNRCPACGSVVDFSGMVYSTLAEAFVCAACQRSGALPRPAEDDEVLAQLAASAPAVVVERSHAPRRPQRRWILPLSGLVAALMVTTLTMVFVARGRPTVDPRRAWEEAHREQIIAIKSQAEALTIQKKLSEAHAKYRELESLVGGHTIGDPRLFDLVDQARVDQSRVYRMILHSMNPAAVDEGPPPAAVDPVATDPRARRAWSPTSLPTSPAASTVDAEAPVETASVPVAADAPQAMAVGIPRQPPRTYNPVTDAQVEQAIRRGVDFLISHFENGQLRRGSGSDVEAHGLNALAVYALLQSSQAISDERLAGKGEFLNQCLEQLKANALDAGGQVDPPATYARSLRASALATFNRPQDREVLEADVKWLINAATEGTYTYDDRFARSSLPRAVEDPQDSSGANRRGGSTIRRLDLGALRPRMIVLAHNGEVMPVPGAPSAPPPPPPKPYKHVPIYQLPQPGYRGSLKPPINHAPWDNSNSQYGVLGVWAGAEVGVEVPQQYWKDVQDHWRRAQFASGQWSYAMNFDASYSMTVGGIATLLVAHDYLEAPLLGNRTAGRKPYDDFLTAGLAYLEHGSNVMDFTHTAEGAMFMVGYNLFGLERVGLASGLKYFGDHDWFVELSAKMLPLQHANGSWGREDSGKAAIIDTSYLLLFLSRGRHPVMMNKLRFEGFWTNRPRDAANLAAYASRELERPVNWQVVDIDHPADDWADAPILYIASNESPRMGAEDVPKIRQFVEAGGLLFTHADQGSTSFSTWAAKLAKDLFPGQALENLSPQHPLYSLNYRIENPRPRLQAVDNGVRLLMVHSPADLSNAWQVRATESRKTQFQLGVNLYLYATGKERFRNRLDTRAVPAPLPEPAPQVDIARVLYDGNWDPEPGAWPRFASVFQNNTGTRLHVHTVTPGELDTAKQIMAVLTGAGPRVPVDDDLPPMAKFIRDGGTLLVDASGGSGVFANAIEQWLLKLDPAIQFEPLAPDDVFVAASAPGAVDLGPERLRLYAIQQLGVNGTRMKSASLGKGRILFTPLDYTTGLLGTNTWGILGYLPEYSEALATNAVLVASKLAKN